MSKDQSGLCERLREHGSAHEYIANKGAKQTQWMKDLYDAADLIERIATASQSTSERERFEAWAKSAFLSVTRSRRRENEYFSDNTQFAWEAWQARAAL